tara:strand:- start:590 stop:1246 length:657 start_codon:yes stop_codon:yes gene_type:complete
LKSFNNTLIPVWKPVDVYSNDIVRAIGDKYSIKAGHAGTLDPFAEGVLIVCTGTETKKITENQILKKKYLATIHLGEETNTLDLLGEVIRKKSIDKKISRKDVEKALFKFKGTVMQRPPAFSALRRNNVRLYSLARKDIYISLKPRPVDIQSLRLVSMGENSIEVEVVCGKGTYIRSLAKDIALELGTLGYLKKLIRLEVGSYNKNSCYEIDSILGEI